MQIVITLNSYEELEEMQGNLARIMSGKTEAAPAPAPKKAAVKKAEPKPEPTPEPEPAKTEETEAKAEDPAEASESDVKVMLAGKIKAGKKAEVRALFEEYGVTKLSELTAKHPDKLAEFAKKAEVL